MCAVAPPPPPNQHRLRAGRLRTTRSKSFWALARLFFCFSFHPLPKAVAASGATTLRAASVTLRARTVRAEHAATQHRVGVGVGAEPARLSLGERLGRRWVDVVTCLRRPRSVSGRELRIEYNIFSHFWQ